MKPRKAEEVSQQFLTEPPARVELTYKVRCDICANINDSIFVRRFDIGMCDIYVKKKYIGSTTLVNVKTMLDELAIMYLADKNLAELRKKAMSKKRVKKTNTGRV